MILYSQKDNEKYNLKYLSFKLFLIVIYIYFSLNFRIKKNLNNKKLNDNLKYKDNKNNNISLSLSKSIIENNISFKFYNKSINNLIYNNIEKNKFINDFLRKKFKFKSLQQVINQLNKDSIFREPKFLIFFDYYNNPYCNDINAYYIFEYYIKKI